MKTRSALGAFFALVLLCDGAEAGDWQITPTLSLSVGATDNVRLAEDGQEEGDLVFLPAAEIEVIGTGGRSSARLDASLTYNKYVDNDELDGLRFDGRGVGTLEVSRDFFFVEGSFAVSEEETDRAVSSGFDRNVDQGRTLVTSFGLSPYLLARPFGGDYEAQVRYRGNMVLYHDPFIGNNASEEDDAFTHEGIFSIAGVEGRNRLTPSLDANWFYEDSDESLEERSFNTALKYDWDSVWRPLIRIGYDDVIDDGDRDDDISGIRWAIGAEISPGPRTDIQIELGERYDNFDVFLRSSYRFSPSGTIRLNADQSVSSGSTDRARNLNRQVEGLEGLEDADSGLSSDPNASDFSSDNNTFINRRLELSIDNSDSRNIYSGRAYLTYREDLSDDSDDEAVWGIRGDYTRILSRKTQVNLSLDFSNQFDAGENEEEDYQTSAEIRLEHALTPTFGIAGGYSFTWESPKSSRDTIENALIIGVFKSF